MNRLVSVLIPLVVLVAMGLVLFQQMMTPKTDMRTQNEVKAMVSPPPSMTTPSAGPTDEAEEAARTAIGRLAAQSAEQFSTAQSMQDHDGEQEDLSDFEELGAPDPTRPNRPPQAESLRRDSFNRTEAPAEPAVTDKPEKAVTSSQTDKPQTPQPQVQPRAEAKPAPRAESKPEASKPEASKGSFVMKSLTLQVVGSEVILKMQADKRFEYRYFLLTGPNRLVVDLAGDWRGLLNPRVPANQLVKSTRYARFGDGYRFVLDLNEAPRTQSDKRSGNVVEIRLSR